MWSDRAWHVDCPPIRRLSDRVLIIQKGRITGEVPRDHLHDDALVAEFVGMSAH